MHEDGTVVARLAMLDEAVVVRARVAPWVADGVLGALAASAPIRGYRVGPWDAARMRAIWSVRRGMSRDGSRERALVERAAGAGLAQAIEVAAFFFDGDAFFAGRHRRG